MKKWLGAVCLAVAMGCTACSEDEAVFPPYQQALADLWTNTSGHAYRILLDNGQSLSFAPLAQRLTPDSVYRVKVMYVEQGERAELYGLAQVFSPKPVVLDTYQRDPLDLKAVWITPRYCNLLVGVKTGGGKHALAFVYKGMTEHPDGRKTLELALAHDQMKDGVYYTNEQYLSCPIYPYEHLLVRRTDSVAIEVTTFKGISRRCFLYGNEH